MARPADADPDETRRRILGAAIPLFAAAGFHGVSTRELAERARVNVNTLSYYFRDKQGVYDATVDEVYRRLSVRAQSAIGAASSRQLEPLLRHAYEAAREERDGIRVLVRQVLDGGRLTPHTEAKHYLPTLKVYSQLAAGVLGCTPQAARTAAVALGYLISRYVIQDEASLKAAFGARTAAEARAHLIATLVATAEALIAPRPKQGKSK